MTYTVGITEFNIGPGIIGSTVVVPHGLGLTPSWIFLHYNSRTESADAQGLQILQRGSGFATSSTVHRCIAGMATHSVAAPRACKGVTRNDSCIAEIVVAGTAGGRAHVQSWDATNVTFVIDAVFTTSFRVAMRAEGGTDVAGVPNFDLTAQLTTGVQSVTGLAVGVPPTDGRALWVALSSGATAFNTVHADDGHMLGFATSPTEQYTLLNGGNDANAVQSQAARYSWYGETLAHWSSGVDSITGRAALGGFLADGLQANWLEATGTADLYACLLIVGPRFAVKKGNTPTATSGTVAVTVGFPPESAIVLSDVRSAGAQNTKVDHDILSVGMWSSLTSQVAFNNWDQDNLATSMVATAIDHDQVYLRTSAAGAVVARMKLLSLASDVATYQQSLGDGSAYQFVTVCSGASNLVDETTQTNPVHVYPFVGTYIARETVTDNDGLTDTVAHTVIVT